MIELLSDLLFIFILFIFVYLDLVQIIPLVFPLKNKN